MARSAASRASFQRSRRMAACATFRRRAPWSSMIMLFSLMHLAGARKRRKVSSACRQLPKASSALPRCHSMRPSFLHFCPKSSAIFRPCMSMRTRPRACSSRFFSSAMACVARCIMSSRLSCKRLASASPPASRRRRALRSSCKVSSRAMSSRKEMPSSLASSLTLKSNASTTLYLSIGATSRFTSPGQSSSSSPSSSRLRLFLTTVLYCCNQTFRRSVQCCSFLSRTLAHGARAASFQNSGSSMDLPKFLLYLGSVRIFANSFLK
mmetsp:Transcript_45421/g.145746  ORF Transcript_45421/g.145746 Transcript_45421/m.145746 type:complete len:266 (+) Transcript_45421:803-1600(+)